MLTESDINRSIIILICEHIYENKSKINFLSACKFMYSLRYIMSYKHINITTNQLPNLKLFNNISSIKIAENKFKTNTVCTNNFIHFLPSKLKKLEIIDNSVVIDNFFPDSLTYLKLSGTIDLKYILGSKIKYLVLCNLPYLFFESNKINLQSHPVERLGLYLKYEFSIDHDLIKKIIPTSVKCFKFNNWKFFDILHEYPSLTKIKFGDDCYQNFTYVYQQINKIPSNVTSICYKYNDYYTIEFFNYIKKTVIYVHIYLYDGRMAKIIPETILKLKIDACGTNDILPTTIRELRIKNIFSIAGKLLCIGSNIKKLTIRRKDQHLLDPNIHAECKIIYKN